MTGEAGRFSFFSLIDMGVIAGSNDRVSLDGDSPGARLLVANRDNRAASVIGVCPGCQGG